jgi:hypothetical protein
MIVDRVVTDVKKTLQQLISALTHGLKAADNFAGDGKAGQVLTSNGPDKPPSWKDLP